MFNDPNGQSTTIDDRRRPNLHRRRKNSNGDDGDDKNNMRLTWYIPKNGLASFFFSPLTDHGTWKKGHGQGTSRLYMQRRKQSWSPWSYILEIFGIFFYDN